MGVTKQLNLHDNLSIWPVLELTRAQKKKGSFKRKPDYKVAKLPVGVAKQLNLQDNLSILSKWLKTWGDANGKYASQP